MTCILLLTRAGPRLMLQEQDLNAPPAAAAKAAAAAAAVAAGRDLTPTLP